MRSTKFLATAIITLIVIVSLSPIVQAQEPPLPPEDPSEPWYPPLEGAAGGYTLAYSFTTSGAGPFSAYLEDSMGNRRTEFKDNEILYLMMWIPAPSIFWLVEYYPPGNVPSRHWLLYWIRLGQAGLWRFGPFIPEPSEPEGIHAWRIWLWSGTWTDSVLRFNYKRTPVSPTDVPTSVTVSVSSTTISIGGVVTVSATVSPVATGGTISIEQSKDGVTWVPLTSGSATGGTVTFSFGPSEPGNYYVQAKYSGFVDTKENKNYLASQSQLAMVKVGKVKTTLSLSVDPEAVSIDIVTHGTDRVTVSGSVTPPIAGATIMLTIEGPVSLTKSLTTTANGAFKYSFSPKEPGEYSVAAYFQGDDRNEPSASEAQLLEVHQNWTTAIVVAIALIACVLTIFLLYRRGIIKRKGAKVNPRRI